MIRRLLAILNKRFPEQLVVTKYDYTELRQEVAELNRYVQGINDLNTRLTALEGKIKQLQDYNGVVTQGKGSFRLER